jgi:hypothetical protein
MAAFGTAEFFSPAGKPGCRRKPRRDYLKERNARQLLHLLAYLKADYKTESDFQLWEEGSHPQMICDDAMMIQKLEYMHMNPVVRGYVDDPLHWRYSSARNYAGLRGLMPVVTDWRD